MIYCNHMCTYSLIYIYIYNMATIFEGPRTPRNSKKGVEGSGTAVISGISVPGSNESYERLFNPQWGTVRSKQGLVVSGGSCCGNPVPDYI